LIYNPNMYRTLPVGVVLRRTPGVTRWARWSWKATAVLPGASDAQWRELRREGEITEYHAATLPLELHGAETEAYVHGLGAEVPCVYVVMRPIAGATDRPFEMLLVTASPYEAQDYCDSAEEVVEKVAMPQGLEAWVRDFVEQFHQDEVFVKRRRDKQRVDQTQDGIGDPRVQTGADVYASPTLKRRRMI
tara:strand:- start:3938 stop:4507 length:570 start_codon:yes stop_codon:yes gene_type:complete